MSCVSTSSLLQRAELINLAFLRSVELAMAAEHGTASSDFNSSIDSAEEDAAVERALLAGETIRMSSLGASGKGGRRDRKEKKRAKKGKGKMIEYSSTDSEDDDDGGMFRGEGTWADDDEDYIRGVQVSLASLWRRLSVDC